MSGENSSIQDVDGETSPPKISIYRLFILACCMGGINFGWVAEYAYATPTFVSLGLDPFWTSCAWLAGPISGLIFLPLASSYSDLCTSPLGRRRPYIIFGLVMGVIGFLLFSNPVAVSHYLGGKGTQNWIALTIAIVAMWLLNIGLNVVCGPAWALVMDLTPSNQQHNSNSIITVISSVSALLAQIIGWINFQTLLGVNSATFIYYAGVTYVVLMSIPTLIGAKEVRLTEEMKEKLVSENRKNLLMHLLQAARNLTRTSVIILLASALTSAAMAPCNFFFTDYIGTVIYSGDPSAPTNSASYIDYEKGVRAGSLMGAVSNAIGIIASATMPWMMDNIGTRIVYTVITIFGIITTALPLYPPFRTVAEMVVMAVAQALLNVAVNIIPPALIGKATNKEEMGTYVGFLNISQVVGQLFGNFVAGYTMTKWNMTIGLATGAFFSMINLVVIIFLTTKDEKNVPTLSPSEHTPILLHQENVI